MTREEQIKQYCAEQGFPYGACSGISSMKAIVATEAIKWADKTMLEKAIEWLKVNIPKRVINISKEDEFKIMIGDKTWDDFIKAMEE